MSAFPVLDTKDAEIATKKAQVTLALSGGAWVVLGNRREGQR